MNNIRKIQEARKIQQMIVDGGRKDDINARVGFLMADVTLLKIKKSMVGIKNPTLMTKCYRTKEFGDVCRLFPKKTNGDSIYISKFTTSLDACQSIMLDGWEILLVQLGKNVFNCDLRKNTAVLGVNEAPTAAEGWLYVILESYIYEWSRDDETE